MDVTFFESQSFFSLNSPQGETEPITSSLDGNFWEIDDLNTRIESPQSKIPEIDGLNTESPQPKIPIPIVPITQIEESVPIISCNNEDDQVNPNRSDKQPETLVYSRRQTVQRGVEPPQPQQQSHESISSLGTEQSTLVPQDNTNDLDLPIALRKGVRSCTQHPIARCIGYSHLSSAVQTLALNLEANEVPKSIQEAMSNPQWKNAVDDEMKALKLNDTWTVVDRPQDKPTVGCRWIFTVKYKADGSIERYKARLVAKGYSQTFGVDYQETFAPVAKLNTIRVLLSLAANLDWKLQQLDVKNAFLNGDLEEEVYMDLPPGFDIDKYDGKVCKLKKSLYGLKQSPRAWFGRFSKAVCKQGYTQAQTDHTMFYRHSQGKITILIVYVDDIIVTGDHHEEIERLKQALGKEFEIKDLGTLRYFLGMEVARSRTGISVCQRKYVLDLLKETGMLGCKPSDTPISPNHKLGESLDGVPVDKGRYQRLVGRLIYLSHTRPDIAFAVSVVSQYMHAPTEEHMEAVYHILRYLKGTPGLGLFFGKDDDRKIKVFTDADWAGSIQDRRSTTGYCTFVWGNLVTWRSKKQSVVARSSAEAEFRALSHGICEIMWLKLLLQELKIRFDSSMEVYCDNKAAIAIAHNPVHHDRTKHVEVDRHFIKEKIEEKIINLMYVPSSDQVADILTKGLLRPVFERLLIKLKLFNLYSPA